MIIELPISNDPAQQFVTQLGDVKYFFTLIYNERSGTWTLDIADDTTRTTLLAGLPLVLGQDLLEPYNLGIGRLLCVDASAKGSDATPDDLGTRVSLYWFSPDEVSQ